MLADRAGSNTESIPDHPSLKVRHSLIQARVYPTSDLRRLAFQVFVALISGADLTSASASWASADA